MLHLYLVPLLALSLTHAPLNSASSAMGGTRHNIVLIVIDDAGVDMIGAYESEYAAYGHPTLPNNTPNIDLLASQGMTFLNAWVAPVCSPTRASILTGKHPTHTGIGAVIASLQRMYRMASRAVRLSASKWGLSGELSPWKTELLPNGLMPNQPTSHFLIVAQRPASSMTSFVLAVYGVRITST